MECVTQVTNVRSELVHQSHANQVITLQSLKEKIAQIALQVSIVLIITTTFVMTLQCKAHEVSWPRYFAERVAN